MTTDERLQQFLDATWANPVMGNTFEGGRERYLEIAGQLGAIAAIATPELTSYVHEGMPEWDETEAKRVVGQEILRKTLAFCPALTNGELGDQIERQSAATTAVGLMYWGDQTMDRRDPHMAKACELLGRVDPQETTGKVRARLTALGRIEDKINYLARPEDAPFVLTCFYDQVLNNEARTQKLSQRYLASSDQQEFLARNGSDLAEISTVSAGFPSISSSLYAIYRQQNRQLPPLSEINASIPMQDMLRVCNVTVRIWDELGDWKMDRGDDPSMGMFVINPFNQYHESFVGRFCELGGINDVRQRDSLQRAFVDFHKSPEARETGSAHILETFRVHARDYMMGLDRQLPPDLRERYDQYITLCKRVLEIGYVNHIGDIALASSGQTSHKELV